MARRCASRPLIVAAGVLMLLAPACALMLATTARADGFDARPVTIETRNTVGSVVITNPGERKIYLETQIYDWSQDAAGHDVLAESETAVASPPATWVGPHSTYNLRIRLPAGAPGQERAFRVQIKQLPDRSDIVAGQITFALTQNLPAFAEPAGMTPAVLRGQFIDAKHILIVNDGGRRARLADIVQDGHLIAPGLIGYALSHSTVAVALSSPMHPGNVEVGTDSGKRTLDVR